MSKDKDTLGPLQQQVLDFIWDNPQTTVRACLDHLNGHGSSYAYTTIQTVFDALHRKQMVSRRRRKNAYVYQARRSRTSLLASRLKDLLARFSQSPAPVASSLVDALEAGDEDELKAVIAELKSRGHLK